MKVVVGLGNPGERYAGTRHNVGFAVIDTLARSSGAGRFQQKFGGEVAEMTAGEHKVLLVKPLTYMNLSGRCVRQVVDFYQVGLEHLLVICDDFNLPLGKLRIRRRGSHGGHRGLMDVQNHLGTPEYPRLRIGVGSPQGQDAVEHVLARFRSEEQPVIGEAIVRAAEAVGVWVSQGIEACMSRYN